MKITRKKDVPKIRIVSHNKKVLYWIIGLLIILIGIVCYLASCNEKIDSFESCVAAGNPVMESYPRQCRDSIKDETFVEEIDDAWKLDNIVLMQYKLEGDYACFGCNDKLCVDPTLEMKQVEETSERYCGPDFEIIEEEIVGGDKDEHGCIGSAGYSWNETKKECVREWEEKAKYYCTEEQRNVDACIEIYQPVCGWNDPEIVQCIKYPCASTYSNSCFACQDEIVEYYINGECPE